MTLTDFDLSELLAALKGGEMTDTIRTSLEWILQQFGRFDPALLTQLRAAGYDRSFEELTPPRIGTSEPLRAPDDGESAARRPETDTTRPSGPPPDVVLDPVVASVRLVGGVTFDPGGIGKGFASDLVVGELRESGAAGAMVSVGGDVCVDGTPPDGVSWVIAVSDPLDFNRVRARFTSSPVLSRQVGGRSGCGRPRTERPVTTSSIPGPGHRRRAAWPE